MGDSGSRHKLKLASRLGAGAFAVIHRGTYDGQEVAVKVLSGTKAASRDARQCFFRESKLMQQLCHENVVGFHALCRVPGKDTKQQLTQQWALVIELMRDGSLQQRILKQVTNPQVRIYSDLLAAQWALDVACGLAYLHLLSPTIIHRDLKLANILLGQDKQQGRLVAKISDFGLHVVCGGDNSNNQNRLLRVSLDLSSGCSPFIHLPAAAAAKEESGRATTNGALPAAAAAAGGPTGAGGGLQPILSSHSLLRDAPVEQQGRGASEQQAARGDMSSQGAKQQQCASDSANGSLGYRPAAASAFAPAACEAFYSEFHTTGGKQVMSSTPSSITRSSAGAESTTTTASSSCLGGSPTARAGTAAAAPAGAGANSRLPAQHQGNLSFSGGPGAAGAGRAMYEMRAASVASMSFTRSSSGLSRRRAQHHTTPFSCIASGGSITAVWASLDSSEGVPPAAAAAAAAGNHHGAADCVVAAQRTGSCCSSTTASSSVAEGACWAEEGSMCSMGTMASLSECTEAGDPYWPGAAYPGAAAAAGGAAGEAMMLHELDVETVFTLTGETGSCLYMAPEVHLRQPYNEKADVFSFGVVLYELFSRSLIMFTELPVSHTDQAAPERYAAKVANGYRPARPKKMPDAIWELVSACWAADPVARPHMSEVVEALEDFIQQLQASKATSASAMVPGALPMGAGASGLLAEPQPSKGCCVIS